MTITILRTSSIDEVTRRAGYMPEAAIISPLGVEVPGHDIIPYPRARFSPLGARHVPRSDTCIVPTRASTFNEAIDGYSNAILLAILRAKEVLVIADDRVHWHTRRTLLFRILLAYLAVILAPVYYLRTIADTMSVPGGPALLSHHAADWLSHLTYARAGWHHRPWLGSYSWPAAYPPGGPLLGALLGVKWATVAMLAGWLWLCCGVGAGSWVGVVAALYAAASLPARHSIFAGRVEVFGWLCIIGAYLVLPSWWAGVLVILAAAFHPAFLGGMYHRITGARPAFRAIRREVPLLRLWAGMCYPVTARLALVVASLCLVSWLEWWPLLLVHLVVCFWSLEGHPRAKTAPQPVYLDEHVATIREHVPAHWNLAFEHDPSWTGGTHLQWLVSYALPNTRMLGGASFDHAPLELVRDAMEMTPDGTWEAVVAKHDIDYVLSTRPTWPTKAVGGFVLPAWGSHAERQVYVCEV